MRYSFRVWLLNLGLIGDEFKNCRMHLLRHLTGNIAWRHPEDAIAQRERLKQKRIAAREQAESAVSSREKKSAEVPDENQNGSVSSSEGISEDETESIGMNM